MTARMKGADLWSNHMRDCLDPRLLILSSNRHEHRRCRRRRLGGRLATMLVDRYFHHYFPFFSQFFSSVATFSHIRCALIRKLILQKLARVPNNHLGAPWQPFWILQAGLRFSKECSDQKTYLEKVDRSAQKPRG